MTKRSQLGDEALNAVPVTLGTLFYGGLYVFGSTDPTPWNKVVKGETVIFTYTGSECQDGENIDVFEDSHRVVISVTETVRA